MATAQAHFWASVGAGGASAAAYWRRASGATCRVAQFRKARTSVPLPERAVAMLRQSRGRNHLALLAKAERLLATGP